MSSISFRDARKNAVDLIRNLRNVRTQVRNNKMTPDLFNQLNGDDFAIEGLVGRDVTAEILSTEELSGLRREIVNKLSDNEAAAFETLRKMFNTYWDEFDKATESYKDLSAEHAHLRPFLKDETAVESVNDHGFFNCGEHLDYAVEALTAVTEFVLKISPVMSRVFDAGDDIPEETIRVPEEKPANAPDTALEPVEGEPKPVVAPQEFEEHQVIETPEQEDENAMKDVVDVIADNRSLGIALKNWSENTANGCGYKTVADVFKAINRIDPAIHAFNDARRFFRNSVPFDTCVADKLACGSENFFNAVDSVKDLMTKAQGLADKLALTSANLFEVAESALPKPSERNF